jgi:hypothetical protein
MDDVWLPPATHVSPYPALPLEVDDACIFRDHILPQPQGVLSELVGFNANVKLHANCSSIISMEYAYGSAGILKWEDQKRLLERCLRMVKGVTKHLPLELRLRPRIQQQEFKQEEFTEPQYATNSIEVDMNFMSGDSMDGYAHPTRAYDQWALYEIQKANIYASELSCRSYIVEKYWNLYDAWNEMGNAKIARSSSPDSGTIQPDLEDIYPSNAQGQETPGSAEMRVERDKIVQDLLMMLASIKQVNMEPNGLSLVCSSADARMAPYLYGISY